MHVHRSAVAEVVEAPNFAQQRLAGEDLIGRACQRQQQVVFLGRKLYRTPIGLDAPRRGDDQQSGELQPLRLARRDRGETRRRIARTRLTSSRGLKGLVR